MDRAGTNHRQNRQLTKESIVTDKVRYGFLGASKIIENQHGKAFDEADCAEVIGIASRRRMRSTTLVAWSTTVGGG